MTLNWQRPQGSRTILVTLGILAFGAFFFLAWETKPWEIDISGTLATGRIPSVHELKDYYCWWGMLGTFLILLVLILTCDFWLRPDPAPPARPWRFSERRGAFFWGILLLVVLLALAPRLPRLDHSSWGDEEWSLRLNVLGEHKVTREGNLDFQEKTWQDVLWGNPRSNNHFLFSILQRTSLDVWRKFTGAGANEFSETILRIPALAAGLLSIALAALLLARWGFPVAGLGAAFLLASHPFHIRYSTEGRGYSLVFLLFLLFLWLAHDAMKCGRWRNWVLFGIVQFLLLYAWMGTAYFLGAANFGMAVALVMGTRWIQLARMAVANSLTVILSLLLLLPGAMQVKIKLETTTALQRPMGLAWLQEQWGHLSLGKMWRFDGDPNELMRSVQSVAAEQPWVWPLTLFVIPCLALAGLLRLSWRHPMAGYFLVAPFLAMLGMFLHMKMEGNYLLPAYGSFLLIPLILMVALGGEALGRGCGTLLSIPTHADPRQRLQLEHRGGAVALLVLGILFAGATLSKTAALIQYPMEPLREVAAFTRTQEGTAAPGESRVVTASLWRRHMLYDPAVLHRFEEPAELLAVAEACRRDGKTLYVIAGHPGYMTGIRPDFHELLSQGNGFEVAREFSGLKAEYSYVIYRSTDEAPGFPDSDR